MGNKVCVIVIFNKLNIKLAWRLRGIKERNLTEIKEWMILFIPVSLYLHAYIAFLLMQVGKSQALADVDLPI